jgi:predicted patatin/cPLA2 family phospholipase
MPGRNRKIYTEFSVGPEFISLRRFLRGGHLMDLDWMWDLTIARMRLDLDRIYSCQRPFLVGLTDVLNGAAVYQITSSADLEQVLKASSALPVIYRGFPLVGGRPMTDGGVSDPIPVAEAIRRGAKRIMVVRSRPRGHRNCPDPMSLLLYWFLRSYPALQATVKSHDRIYNEAVSLIRHPPDGVSIIEICPPESFRPGRFTRDAGTLLEGYEQGKPMAGEAIARWERDGVNNCCFNA